MSLGGKRNKAELFTSSYCLISNRAGPISGNAADLYFAVHEF